MRISIVGNLVMIMAAVVLWTAMGLGSGVDDGRWLQQLYNATGGGGWGTCNSGWNMTAGANPCSGSTSLWNRVWCNSNGRVYQVELSYCNLRGTLPELDTTSISGGAMSQLQYMSLYSNQLSGPLPASWGNLSSLQHMYLYNNQLSGPLPASYENLNSLQDLYLYSNRLTGGYPSSWVNRLIRLISAGLRLQLNCLDYNGIPSSELSWWNIKSNSGSLLVPQLTNCSEMLCSAGRRFIGGQCRPYHSRSNTSTVSSVQSITTSRSTTPHIASSSRSASLSSTSSSLTSASVSVPSSLAASLANNRVSTVLFTSLSVASVVTSAVVISMLSVTGGGAPLQRSLLQSRLNAGCDGGPASDALGEPLDVASSPTRLSAALGNDATRFVQGAVIGNMALLAAVAAAAYAWKWARLPMFRFDLPLPGWMVQPGMLLLQPTVSSAVACLASPSPGGIAVGVFGAICAAGGVVWIAWHVLFHFNAEAVPRSRRLTTGSQHRKKSSAASAVTRLSMHHLLFEAQWRWRSRRVSMRQLSVVPAGACGRFVARYGPLFEAYRRSMHGFMCIEYAASVAFAIVGGLLPYWGCSSGLLWTAAVVNLAMLLLVVALHPYNSRWDLMTSVASNALGVAWGVTVVWQHASPPFGGGLPDVLTAVQAYLQIAAMIVPPSVTLVASLVRRSVGSADKTSGELPKSMTRAVTDDLSSNTHVVVLVSLVELACCSRRLTE